MPKEQRTYCVIAFRSSREPLDDLLLAEAVDDGQWTEVKRVERIKYRRDLIDEISAYSSALVAIDAPLGFPKPFIDFLGDEAGSDWKSRAKIIREELKKNTEDGIKRWVERMGRYRESNLETADDYRRAKQPINRSGRRFPEPRMPYELRSKAERFRRIEHIVRRLTNKPIESTLGIRYNKLVSRYDFLESEAQGRRSLMAIALLEQLRERSDSAAVWPFEQPKSVTVVEVMHSIFPTIGTAADIDSYFDAQEDNALYIPDAVRIEVKRSAQALTILTSLLGMLGAERREYKAIRPLRDYRDNFYADPVVQTEGWIYGIGYKQPAKTELNPVPEIPVSDTTDVSAEQR